MFVLHMYRLGLDNKISMDQVSSTVRHFTTVSVSLLVLYGLIITVANEVASYEVIKEGSSYVHSLYSVLLLVMFLQLQ